MKPENHSQAIEDYLKVIYELTFEFGRATTTQIAEAMALQPPSVTAMIQRLAAATVPLVEYRKHFGVVLTSEGKRAALQVLRRHRLLEQFLQEILGFSWDEVHDEAHRLEHVISERFVERMAEVLGRPRYDPHGAPIPTRELELPEKAGLYLNEIKSGQQGVIKQVPDDDPDILRYLGATGLIPGARFEVVEFTPFDELQKIQVDGQPEPVVFGPKLTRKIFVELDP